MTDQQVERRRHRRQAVLIECRIDGVSERVPVLIRDLTIAGCFIDTVAPLPVGSHVTMHATLGGSQVTVSGTIIRDEPKFGVGFGILFDEVSELTRRHIEEFLRAAV